MEIISLRVHCSKVFFVAHPPIAEASEFQWMILALRHCIALSIVYGELLVQRIELRAWLLAGGDVRFVTRAIGECTNPAIWELPNAFQTASAILGRRTCGERECGLFFRVQIAAYIGDRRRIAARQIQARSFDPLDHIDRAGVYPGTEVAVVLQILGHDCEIGVVILFPI